jgi:hypothetical protein
VGDTFDAAVLDLDDKPNAAKGTIAIDNPAVRAKCHGPGMVLGERVTVRLTDADPTQRKVTFETTP